MRMPGYSYVADLTSLIRLHRNAPQKNGLAWETDVNDCDGARREVAYGETAYVPCRTSPSRCYRICQPHASWKALTGGEDFATANPTSLQELCMLARRSDGHQTRKTVLSKCSVDRLFPTSAGDWQSWVR